MKAALIVLVLAASAVYPVLARGETPAGHRANHAARAWAVSKGVQPGAVSSDCYRSARGGYVCHVLWYRQPPRHGRVLMYRRTLRVAPTARPVGHVSCIQLDLNDDSVTRAAC